jgi:lactate permease
VATVWATLPLLAALAALVGRWPATRAAALGSGVALLLTGLHPAFRTPPERLAGALLDGAAPAVAVVSVVYGGLVFFGIMQRGGALARLAAALAGLGADRPALALTLVLGWGPFVESASGFGVAAAVTAPLLLALGFPRDRAILLALLGLCAVPWGALAVGLTLGAHLTGLDPAALGTATALLSLPVFAYTAVLAGWLAAGRAAWRRWPLGLALAAALGGGIWAGSRWLSVELAGLLGGLAALALGVAWLAAEQRGRRAREQGSAGPRAGPTLVRAVAPYALLVGLLLATRLVPPLAQALQGVLVLTGPSGTSRLPLLAGSGTLLLVAALGGAAVLRLPARQVVAAALDAVRQWWRPALATAGFVALGQLMVANGMTATLAGTLASLGPGAPVAVVPLGALGGFLTGSNAGANAMLAVLSAESARRLGLSPVVMLALLGAAASHVTMASPPRLLLALAVAGTPAAERRQVEAAATRRMLAIAAGTVALLMLTALMLVLAAPIE